MSIVKGTNFDKYADNYQRDDTSTPACCEAKGAYKSMTEGAVTGGVGAGIGSAGAAAVPGAGGGAGYY